MYELRTLSGQPDIASRALKGKMDGPGAVTLETGERLRVA